MGNERIRLMVLIALFAGTFGAVQVAKRYHHQQKRVPNWDVVHYHIDGWSGFDSRFDPIYGADPSDASLLRVYQQAAEPPVIVYVGFFGDLAAILDVHTPEICYPSEGWQILHSGKSTAGSFRGQKIQARQILADKSGNRRLVVWWYNAGSRPIETRIRYIYAMLAMATVTGRTDGSIVRLETPVDAKGEATAEARIAEFRRRLLPELDKALPQ